MMHLHPPLVCDLPLSLSRCYNLYYRIPDRRRANRSSVADLAKLYATQLSALYTMIEGSSKYVPAVPGRHIVAEIDNFWALNAATYKVEYAVHFVLLDDSLLVAKRRKRRTGEAGKLVAERCWPLNDISILDMKDTQGMFVVPTFTYPEPPF